MSRRHARGLLTPLLGWLLPAGLLAVAVALVGGYTSGLADGREAAQAEHRRAVEQEHARYVEAVQIGNRAASQLSAQLRQVELNRNALARRLRDVPTHVGSVQCPDPGAAQLTLGAVRLLNSAAAGADLPAGACGADAASDAACADGSGVSINAAFAVTQENSRRYADCARRMNALIDELERRQSTGAPR